MTSDVSLPEQKKRHHHVAKSPWSREVHVKRVALEGEISALKHQHERLRKRAKEKKRKQVSKPELLELQAGLRSGKADRLQFRLDEIMAAYISTLQDCSVARSACTVLEERVSAEAQKREAMKNEFVDLAEILDISNMRPVLPPLLHPGHDLVFKDEHDLASRIRTVEKEILAIDSGKPISNAESSAAFEISRSCHLEVQKSAQDKNGIQTAITSLSAIARQMETDNQQSESENRKLQLQMQQMENEQRQQEIEACEATNGQSAAQERNMQRMSEAIKDMKRQIDSAARHFEILKEETDELRQELMSLETRSEAAFNFEEYSEYDEESDIFVDVNEETGMSAYLIGKRDSLLSEIESLQREITDFRINAGEREGKLKGRIEHLRTREMEYKRILSELVEGDSSDSDISPTMAHLLRRIDANIVDLAVDQ
jgi:chromosome segregation ATPase